VLVNISDCLQFWSEGYLASTLHRVVSDTEAQRRQARFVIGYFLRPEVSALALCQPTISG
jgi:isopenicillin N synthase-like dioxygenase